MTDLYTVYINGEAYNGDNKIMNLYFKQKKDQVGRFEFDAYALDSDDLENFVERQILFIDVWGTTRMYGFITKVSYDKFTHIYHIEGQSLAGILDTKTTNIPCILRLSDAGVPPYTKELVREIVFRFGGFKSTGTSGWTISGDIGVPLFFYKMDVRTVLDHVSTLAKISGYNWRCYM